MKKDEIKEMVNVARHDWNVEVSNILNETSLFSQNIGKALGEISRDEAIKALQKFFEEKLAGMK